MAVDTQSRQPQVASWWLQRPVYFTWAQVGLLQGFVQLMLTLTPTTGPTWLQTTNPAVDVIPIKLCLHCVLVLQVRQTQNVDHEPGSPSSGTNWTDITDARTFRHT
jgi:hypothetical protein